MPQAVQNPPAGYHSLTPYMTVRDANAAIDFYRRAFGAQEISRIPAEGGQKLIHVHLRINGGDFVFNDAFPEHGHPLEAPKGYSLLMVVDDIDAWWKRAIDAGAEEVMPVQKMFWGDRYGQLKDPFGVTWALDEPA